MFDEIAKSIKAELYDRSVSPLMGSFIISWSLWNYKFLLVLFSKLKIDEKLEKIDQFFYPTIEQEIFYFWIGPLATTLIYIFIYPRTAKPVFEFARESQKELKIIKAKIEDETPLSIEESRALKNKYSILEDGYLKEIERKNREIERLKQDNKTYEGLPTINIGSINEEELNEVANNASLDELSEDEFHLISNLSMESNENIWKQNFINGEYNDLGIRKVTFLLGELEKKGYLETSGAANGDTIISFTHKGLEYLIRNGLD